MLTVIDSAKKSLLSSYISAGGILTLLKRSKAKHILAGLQMPVSWRIY
jgi:hypothetical protein